MKNNIFTFLLMAVVAIPFTACKKDGDSDPQGELTGTWTLERTETTYRLSDEAEETIVRDYSTETGESTITLTSDGRILVKDWDEDEETHIETSGTFEIRDGKIYASVAGETFPFDNGFDYTIAGNRLTITGDDTIFVEALGINAEVSIRIIARR